ncbi:hypothetical protein [Trichormus azollae]|uniref:hypothetical protein n=1 Tax=Trichormus azollae TaxID=1164 RepID=UPI00325C76CC
MAVHGKNRHLQLLVEAKNKCGASKIWAATMRRNMYVLSWLTTRSTFFSVSTARQILFVER